MKKIFIYLSFFFIFAQTSFSQTNFGLFVGGGFSFANFKYETDLPNNSVIILNVGGAFAPAYHAGLNFENTIIEKMLYFQLGIQGMSKGYKYSDDLFMIAHSIHIPLEIKYKYFFNRKGKAFVYASLGPYVSASFIGVKYNKFDVESFIEDDKGDYEMDNPRIKFGKVLEDESADMSTFDFGINAGSGFGFFGNMQVGFNYGLGLPVFAVDAYDYDFDGENDSFYYYRHSYMTMTVSYYFSNK